MGMVRVLLAIAVVFQHTYGTLFDGGYIAVQLFFIVSGFVISFILVEQQSYPTPGAFYKNRVLRLFPIYYAVAIGSLVFYMTLPLITGNPTSFPLGLSTKIPLGGGHSDGSVRVSSWSLNLEETSSM